jgi:hypothetical protein
MTLCLAIRSKLPKPPADEQKADAITKTLIDSNATDSMRFDAVTAKEEAEAG